MLFLSGSGDIVNLTGGTNTITDTGEGNTYIIPAAGKGIDTFTSNILNNGDTLDLKPRTGGDQLEWVATTLAKYLSVTDTRKVRPCWFPQHPEVRVSLWRPSMARIR